MRIKNKLKNIEEGKSEHGVPGFLRKTSSDGISEEEHLDIGA